MQYVKALAAAVVSFLAVIVVVWADKSISLDEMNTLWLAFVPVLTAIGVAAAPKNQQ
jgi:hypothetical protein